jgi:MFS family permease
LQKFDFKKLTVVGIGLVTIGVLMISFLSAGSSYWFHLFPAFVLLATGFGVSFVSITVAATSGVPPHETGLAAGLINTSQQVGSALGLAVLAVVANSAIAARTALGDNAIQASVYGYHQAFLTATALVFIAFLIAIFVIRVPKSQ